MMFLTTLFVFDINASADRMHFTVEVTILILEIFAAYPVAEYLTIVAGMVILIVESLKFVADK